MKNPGRCFPEIIQLYKPGTDLEVAANLTSEILADARPVCFSLSIPGIWIQWKKEGWERALKHQVISQGRRPKQLRNPPSAQLPACKGLRNDKCLNKTHTTISNLCLPQKSENLSLWSTKELLQSTVWFYVVCLNCPVEQLTKGFGDLLSICRNDGSDVLVLKLKDKSSISFLPTAILAPSAFLPCHHVLHFTWKQLCF